MTANDLAQCALERRKVELALQPDDRREIVRGTVRLELVEEPESLLRERKRKRAIAGSKSR